MEDLWLKTIENLDKDGSLGICYALKKALPYDIYSIGGDYYHTILDEYFKDTSAPYWAGSAIDINGNWSDNILSQEETYWRRVNICLLMHELYIRGEI